MPQGRETHSRARGRLALAAWLGVMALLVQALLPAASLAASTEAPGVRLVICTDTGAHLVTVAERAPSKKGFAGLPCHDCLGAATAALPAPVPALVAVRYAEASADRLPERPEAQRLARAPPRPPGQGPPVA